MDAFLRNFAPMLNRAVATAPELESRLLQRTPATLRADKICDALGPEKPRSRRAASSAGRTLRVLVACALGALIINTWLVAGLWMPLRVVSDSMAPALLGPHREWTCVSCNRNFVYSAEELPASKASCPSCGAANDVETGRDVGGQRVLVDRSAFLWRAPRRWEIVVLRSPEEPAMLCVKRIVGLPGESLQIMDGKVVADGCSLNAARGIYYLPGRQGESRVYQLEPDEYFVLGDNSSSSVDSRHWHDGGGVSANLLVGRALSW